MILEKRENSLQIIIAGYTDRETVDPVGHTDDVVSLIGCHFHAKIQQQPIKHTTWLSVELRYQHEIFRVESQTSLEGRGGRELSARKETSVYLN